MTNEQLKNLVKIFSDVYQKDINSRLMSYDHLHKLFMDKRNINDAETNDSIALSLFVFLGSWGMLRNSSLIKKDYKFLIPLVQIIKRAEYDVLFDIDWTDIRFQNNEYRNHCIDQIVGLKSNIEEWWNDNRIFEHNIIPKEITNEMETSLALDLYLEKTHNSDVHESNITYISDTLLGKILLGTLGCIPAYDSNVKRGLKEEGYGQTINRNCIEQLVDYCQTNRVVLLEIKAQVDNIVSRCSTSGLMSYPIAKIIDMLFWEYGYFLNGKKNNTN